MCASSSSAATGFLRHRAISRSIRPCAEGGDATHSALLTPVTPHPLCGKKSLEAGGGQQGIEQGLSGAHPAWGQTRHIHASLAAGILEPVQQHRLAVAARPDQNHRCATATCRRSGPKGTGTALLAPPRVRQAPVAERRRRARTAFFCRFHTGSVSSRPDYRQGASRLGERTRPPRDSRRLTCLSQAVMVDSQHATPAEPDCKTGRHPTTRPKHTPPPDVGSCWTGPATWRDGSPAASIPPSGCRADPQRCWRSWVGAAMPRIRSTATASGAKLGKSSFPKWCSGRRSDPGEPGRTVFRRDESGESQAPPSRNGVR